MTALTGTPLSHDMLTGTIQTRFGPSQRMTTLHVRCNRLNGSMPALLARMKAMLQMDYLYANGYTGTTWSEFRKLVIVTIVAVSHKLKLRK